jgi:uncharacterized protein YndB with AHSA1/START domain
MPTQPSEPSVPECDREIVLSRVFHAPRALVWEAWSNPKHVVNWLGPRGGVSRRGVPGVVDL